MTIISEPATDAYRSGWDVTFGKQATAAPPPAQPRAPSKVIDAVLRCVPVQRSDLRLNLVRLLGKSALRAPEDQQLIWIALVGILRTFLSVPPQLPWEQQISDIVEGRATE
jgi:hypothetical protein